MATAPVSAATSSSLLRCQASLLTSAMLISSRNTEPHERVIRGTYEATLPICLTFHPTASDMLRLTSSSSVVGSALLATVIMTSTCIADPLPIGDVCNSNSECESNFCSGYTPGSGTCFVASAQFPPADTKGCNTPLDCAVYPFAYCGTIGRGAPNVCYWSGAYCAIASSYISAECPTYDGCSNTGLCAAGPGPSQLAGRRHKRDIPSCRQGGQASSQQLVSTTQALCPGSYTACPLKGSYSGGFECLNLQEELNACGSCGNDCEAAAEPGQFAGCVEGVCVYGPLS